MLFFIIGLWKDESTSQQANYHFISAPNCFLIELNRNWTPNRVFLGISPQISLGNIGDLVSGIGTAECD